MTVNRYADSGVAPAQFFDTKDDKGRKVGRPRKGFDANGLKACSKCKLKKSRDHYHVDRSMSTGYSSVCAECRREKRKLVSNDAKRRDYNLQYKYGVTKEWFDEMLVYQDFGCAVCDKKFTGEEYGHKAMVVDHSHDTGAPRGLLCRVCNLGLGKFRDSEELLQNAIKYLQSHKE